MAAAVITHRRYLDGLKRLTRMIQGHVHSLDETDMWTFQQVRRTGDLEDSLSDHLECRCAECANDVRNCFGGMPAEESAFLAACITLTQRHYPRSRTAASLWEFRMVPVFSLAVTVIRKYWDGSGPAEDLTAAQINAVLDVLWTHVRSDIADGMSPTSRRTP